MSEEKSYISYFQSIVTVGILNKGKDKDDAIQKAKLSMYNKDEVRHWFQQSDFEFAAVEEWSEEVI